MTCKEKRERLKKIRCFVLDMDGTIYLGNRLFPFTPAFLQAVEKSGREFCYFTNNSSKNAATYLQKLASMGIPTTPEKMLISNGVIIDWLNRNHPGKSVYLVGTPVSKILSAGSKKRFFCIPRMQLIMLSKLERN